MKTGITLAVAALGAIGGTGIMSGFHMPFVGNYAPPAQCIEWYNGCNMCQKESDGTVSCTNRVCDDRGKGFCRESASTTPEGQ